MARRRKLPLLILLAVAVVVGIRWAGRPRVDARLVGAWVDPPGLLNESQVLLKLHADGRWINEVEILGGNLTVFTLLMRDGFRGDVQTWDMIDGVLVLQASDRVFPRSGDLAFRFKESIVRFQRWAWGAGLYKSSRRFEVQTSATNEVTLVEIPDPTLPKLSLVIGSGQRVVEEQQPEESEADIEPDQQPLEVVEEDTATEQQPDRPGLIVEVQPQRLIRWKAPQL